MAKKKNTNKKKVTTTKKKTTSTKKKQVTKKKTTTKKVKSIKTTLPKEFKSPIEQLKDESLIVKRVTKERINHSKKVYIALLFYVFICLYYYLYTSGTPNINNMYIDDSNNVVIEYKLNKLFRNKIYCKVNDSNWILTQDNKCIYKLENKDYTVYLKNQDNFKYLVSNTNKIGKVLNIKSNKNKLYIPVNGTDKIDIEYESIGYVGDIEYSILDESIVNISSGVIKGLKKGTTKVTASIMDKSISFDVIVTNLITSRPKTFDLKKPYLPCNKYNDEENQMLDEILKNKIDDAGYKTRAGVVEAARFLTLDFPYRIKYFYENGRQTTNNVDGEGRYYHKGLYLSKSKYKSITGSRKGPKIWGCMLYSTPDKKKDPNGLDCSGFVSWALLNGGFDVKDVGAGWSDNLDLTDYGTVKRITSSLAKSNDIKVGDLLHSTRLGGHIGIIVGIDKNNYYVAQAIWYNPIGVVITKYKKEKLSSDFPHVVLMDKYYKKDGNLTNMW